jgi:hypothetical protein
MEAEEAAEEEGTAVTARPIGCNTAVAFRFDVLGLNCPFYGLVSSPRQALSGTVRHRQAQSGTVVAPGVG